MFSLADENNETMMKVAPILICCSIVFLIIHSENLKMCTLTSFLTVRSVLCSYVEKTSDDIILATNIQVNFHKM